MTTRRSILAMFVGSAIAAPILKYGWGETLWPGTDIIKPEVARTLTTMRPLAAHELVRVQEVFATNDANGGVLRWIALPDEEIIAEHCRMGARADALLSLTGQGYEIKNVIYEHPDGWIVSQCGDAPDSPLEAFIEVDADGKRIVAPFIPMTDADYDDYMAELDSEGDDDG